MDKAVNSTLQFDVLLNMIIPVGESGRHFKHHLPIWKSGQEALLRKEFLRLEAMISMLKKHKPAVEQFRNALADIPWLPQTLKAMPERPLHLHECFELKKLVYYALQLKELCSKHNLTRLYPFPDLEKPYALLDPEHRHSPSFALSSAFDPKLAQYLAQLQDLQLTKRQTEHQLMKTAQKSLHLSQTTATIVISRLQTAKLKSLSQSPYYQLADENFANLTFKLKDSKQLITLKKQISLLTTRLSKTEEVVLKSLSKKLKSHAKAINRTAELICKLDWDYAKAIFAIQHNCVIPILSSKIQLRIPQAVNLPLKQHLTASGRNYQPIDLLFSSGLNVLTGPNMGGKTTALITAGQICLMAKYAIPIPAGEAELCLFDNVWFNRDSTHEENLSSFGREIVSLSNILKKKGRNLLLMDELAKGTNPAEGEVILIAVLDYAKKLPCLTLAATHFDKPAYLKSAAHYAIKGIDLKTLSKLITPTENNLKEQLNLLNTLMDYSLIKLSKSTKPPQNAIPIAQALGLPEEIIQKALHLIK